MTAIVFAPFTSSPNTQGTGVAALRLAVVGLGTVAALGTTVEGYGIVELPALTTAGTGTMTTHTTGSGVATLPAIFALGQQATVPATTVTGYGIGYLPSLTTYGVAPLADFAPQHGDGIATLPAFTTSGTGTMTVHTSGTGVASVSITAFGHNYTAPATTVTGYGAPALPSFETVGFESEAAFGDAWAVVLPQPGYAAASHGVYLASIADASTIFAGLKADIAPYIVDGMRLRDSLNPILYGTALAADAFVATDAMSLVWTVLLSDAMEGADALSQVLTLRDQLTETLLATGAVTSSQQATVAIVQAALIEDLTRAGWSVDALSTAAGTDAVVVRLQAMAQALASAQLDADMTHVLRMTAFVDDAFDTTTGLATSAQLFAAIADGMQMFASIRIGDDEYSCWVLSTSVTSDGRQIPAVVEYRNFPFNSFCEFDGRYFGASEHGIYELVGNTDDGDEIAAWARTALTNMGTGKYKRLPTMYLGYTASGQMVLKVVTTSATGQKVEDYYTMKSRMAEAMRENRIKIGMGLKSVYWAFELANVDGCDFSIDELQLFPLVLERRV